MTKGISTRLATELPAQWTPLSTWAIDWRSSSARALLNDLTALHQDLGGAAALSTQERLVCERIAYLWGRCRAYESATMAGTTPPMTAGEYSNHCNVLLGLTKTIGLRRRARPAEGLHEYMARKGAQSQSGGEGSR